VLTTDSSTRHQVLHAALKKFADCGYEGTSVQDIVETARVTKPTLYYYFGNKAELYQALVDYAHDERRRLMQANLVGPAGYISMEDGAATGFVQRGVAGSPERASVIEMGGSSVGSGDSRITETAVRGLWKAWRSHMSI